jgi:hypothetical protein
MAIAYISQSISREKLNEFEFKKPELLYSPRLWFSGRNPLHIHWTTKEGISHEVSCEITRQPQLTPTGILGLECEQAYPDTFAVSQLPRP